MLRFQLPLGREGEARLHQDHMRKFKTTNYFRENRTLDGLHQEKVTVPNPRKTTPKVRDRARQQPSLYQDSETSAVVVR